MPALASLVYTHGCDVMLVMTVSCPQFGEVTLQNCGKRRQYLWLGKLQQKQVHYSKLVCCSFVDSSLALLTPW